MSALQPLAHHVITFISDGKKYDVERFAIEFSQPIDYKGQPQSNVRGGQIMINLTQLPDDNLYIWAKKSTLRKDGKVLFQTDLGMTVLEIDFKNAYCINLTIKVNAFNGTETSLTISPEIIIIDGIEHDNFWPS
ncbi:MAG: hypothetical protein FWF53_09710 [Candidatus Azobacteroides sp.]|nr:hypothetical protein [Candidatus Azobacteroides sp.]